MSLQNHLRRIATIVCYVPLVTLAVTRFALSLVRHPHVAFKGLSTPRTIRTHCPTTAWWATSPEPW